MRDGGKKTFMMLKPNASLACVTPVSFCSVASKLNATIPLISAWCHWNLRQRILQLELKEKFEICPSARIFCSFVPIVVCVSFYLVLSPPPFLPLFLLFLSLLFFAITHVFPSFHDFRLSSSHCPSIQMTLVSRQAQSLFAETLLATKRRNCISPYSPMPGANSRQVSASCGKVQTDSGCFMCDDAPSIHCRASDELSCAEPSFAPLPSNAVSLNVWNPGTSPKCNLMVW